MPGRLLERRTVTAPPERTEVRWYERIADLDDVPGRWLRAAAHLPAAVPRRFDDEEPLRRRFDREGSEGFTAVWLGLPPRPPSWSPSWCWSGVAHRRALRRSDAVLEPSGTGAEVDRRRRAPRNPLRLRP